MATAKPRNAKSNGRKPAPPPTAGEAQSVLGARGLAIWGGRVTEEYLRELQPWRRRVKVYREMADDAVCGTLLDAIKLPLLAADFNVTPAGATPADVEAADFLWQAMNGMRRQTWRSHVSMLLECLDFGFAIGEIVLEKREDGRLWIANIEPRGQETLYKWELDGDRPVAFVQGPFEQTVITQIIAIPLAKCIHVVFGGRKDNPEGQSLLRSVYRPWRFLKNLENFEGIGVERDVGGMPVATLPPEPLTQTQIDDLKTALTGLRMDEEMYLITPHGVEITAYAAGQKSYDIRSIITAKQKEILMRFFAQFLMLGMDRVGTQALVEGSQDFFALALEGVQQVLLETWQNQLVPYLFSYNSFGNLSGLPIINWDLPGRKDIVGLLTAFDKAATAGLLTPTRADEERLRDLLDLPDLPEGIGDEPRVPRGGSPTLMGFAKRMPDLRRPRSLYQRFANAYQKELVALYDTWAAETERLAMLGGRTDGEIQRLLDARLAQLSIEMQQLGRTRIAEAAGIGLGRVLGKRISSPEVQRVAAEFITRNEEFIITGLIPSLRARFTEDLAGALAIAEPALRRENLKAVLAVPRARVATYSGGAVVAIFEGQKAASKAEDAERASRGMPPIAVRWVLDPTAEHCEDDPVRATFGCPGLARVYPDGWESMPTVPAGNVSCLGSCRCDIELDFGDGRGWQRVA